MPRPNPDIPKTTTARPKPFVLDVGSLEDRTFAIGGMDVLRTVARRQKAFVDCTTNDLPELDGAAAYSASIPLNLQTLGYLKVRESAKSGNNAGYRFTLTPAGWAKIGEPMPLYLEGAA